LLAAPVAFVVLVTVGASLLYLKLTDSEWIRSQVQQRLRAMVNADVTIGSAAWFWPAGLSLRELRVLTSRDRSLREPWNDADSEFFRCESAYVQLEPWSLLTGRVRVRSVTADRAVATVVRFADAPAADAASLFRDIAGRKIAGHDNELPTVELIDARLRLMLRTASETRLVEERRLDVRGVPGSRRDPQYDLVWQDRGSRGDRGRCRLDLQSSRVRNIDGGLPAFSLAALASWTSMPPDHPKSWSEILHLTGTIRVTDFDVHLDSLRQAGFATIALEGAAFSMPINDDEVALSASDRYLRIENANGLVQINEGVVRGDVSASFHDSPCHIVATIIPEGARSVTSAPPGFQAEISLGALLLPRNEERFESEARFIQQYPPVARFYDLYDPRGRASVTLSLEKTPSAESEVQLKSLVVKAQGGDASFRNMPYRVSDLRGQIEVTPDRIAIRDLCGTHGTGEVEVRGEVSGIQPGADADVWITGRNLSVDDSLWSAMPESYRMAAEPFDPQGNIDLELHMIRSRNAIDELPQWTSHCRLAFNDLSVCYEHFPYSLEHVAGTVDILGKEVWINDVRAEHGGSRVTVSGLVTSATPQSSGVHVAIRAENIVLDDELLSALPDNARREMIAMQGVATGDVTTLLSRDIGGDQLIHESAIALRDGSIRLGDGPAVFTNIHGDIAVSQDGVSLDSVEGRYDGGGLVSANGILELGSTSWSSDLNLHAENLNFDERLLRSMPVSIRSFLQNWHVNGPFTIDARWSAPPDSSTSQTTLRGMVAFSNATIRHDRLTSPIREVVGELHFDELGFRADEINGRHADADLTLSLDLFRTKHQPEGTIDLRANGLRLDDSLRTLLPDQLQVRWQESRLQGSLDLDHVRLTALPPNADGRQPWTVAGQVRLNSISSGGATPVSDLNGVLSVDGWLVDPDGGIALSGDFALDRATAFHHPLSDVVGRWQFAQVPQGMSGFTMDRVRARVYDGTISGNYETHVDADDPRSQYALTLDAHNIDITPMIGVGSQPGKGEAASASTGRGRADLHLFVSGKADVLDSRRGGGRVEIREAQLVRLPLLMAIFDGAGLVQPVDEELHSARGTFYITGSELNLQPVEFRGDTLALSGSGTVSLPDRGLDLRLVVLRNHRWLELSGLSSLVNRATRDLIGVRVTGSIRRPVVRMEPMNEWTDEIRQLLKRKPPPRLQSAGS